MSASSHRVLVVEDEPGIRFGIRRFLSTKGFDVAEAESCSTAVDVFREFQPEAAVLDYALPDGNAVDLLARLKALDPTVPLVILTAHGSIDLAVRAIKEGAEQFLTKPIELPTLHVVLRRLIEGQRDRRRRVARDRMSERRPVDPFLGSSDAIRRLADEARRVVLSDRPVILQGSTGVGKTLLANWLHANGPRAEEPFLDLNCASLPRELLESELFGHDKGAFTGAVAARAGLLQAAHRGTLFLDEIGDMDVALQPKLLKVLEEQRFRRLGETTDRRVDVRLIAATHQDLEERVRLKQFRADLYFRISTLPLTVPSLCERCEDIPFLARALLGDITTDLGRGEFDIARDALAAMMSYAWPGNIRELRNILERAVLLSDRPIISRKALHLGAPGSSHEPSSTAPTGRMTLLEGERRIIEQTLNEEGGRVDVAARSLGLSRSALYAKIKKHGIAVPLQRKHD